MKALKVLFVLFLLPAALFPQSKITPTKAFVPKYDKSLEAVFRGTVLNVREHLCPLSGGEGSHLVMRLADGKVIEVHLATSRFVRHYDLNFKIGESVEITGVQVIFEGTETIFARKVKRGSDEFLFRDNDGTPIW